MHFRSHIISSSLLKDFTKRPKYRELLVSYFVEEIFQAFFWHVHYFTRHPQVVSTWVEKLIVTFYTFSLYRVKFIKLKFVTCSPFLCISTKKVNCSEYKKNHET